MRGRRPPRGKTPRDRTRGNSEPVPETAGNVGEGPAAARHPIRDLEPTAGQACERAGCPGAAKALRELGRSADILERR